MEREKTETAKERAERLFIEAMHDPLFDIEETT